jgi:hypothetical protein
MRMKFAKSKMRKIDDSSDDLFIFIRLLRGASFISFGWKTTRNCCEYLFSIT